MKGRGRRRKKDGELRERRRRGSTLLSLG